ncbi:MULTISPECIES: hypothetical protein [unclassified Pseudoxanthomonas]|jgi:hypothetical protein|uniref:hypothetical protein n=1 Tax=unclassified Pseudoxanthomonas TaxID=2645906 RepID=UPI00307845E4
MKDETCLPRAELDRLIAQLEQETRSFYQHYAQAETRCREFGIRGAAIRARALPEDEPYVFARLCALYARCNGFRERPSKFETHDADAAIPRAEQRGGARIANVIRAIREAGLVSRLRHAG